MGVYCAIVRQTVKGNMLRGETVVEDSSNPLCSLWLPVPSYRFARAKLRARCESYPEK